MTDHRRKIKRAAIGFGSVMLALLVILGLVLATQHDLNPGRPWINRTVSAAIDRPFAINGNLQLHWVRDVASLHYRFPRPQISAEELVIGNPEKIKARGGEDFARVKKITAVIDPLPLFGRTVVLPLLDVETAEVVLERREDGRNNWTFGDPNEPSKNLKKRDPKKQWRVAPGLLRVHNSWVQLDDVKRKLAMRASADSYEQGIRWRVQGTLNDGPLNGHGMAGSLLALQDKETPYPIAFTLNAADTHIEASGTLTNPSQLAALDVNLKISGTSMAQLYMLTGILLPETPPFSTDGHLHGVLDEYGGTWHYEKFNGKVGNSDLHGTVVVKARATRPLLTAKLTSENLDLADLAPLIGADSNESKERRHAEVRQPPDKLLPIEPFKTDRWRSIDADVKFAGKRIVREKASPIENLEAAVDLTDGVLKLTPLKFGIAGGELTAQVRLDSREAPPHADIKLRTHALQLKQLFPASETMQPSLGDINGSAELTARGDSIATLAGSASGELRLFMDRATLSKFLLEAAGLNVANAVAAKVFGDAQIQLNCAAADFNLDDGQMQSEGFVIDTDNTVINIDGGIDLDNEKLDLNVKPHTKGLRLLTLRGPLHVDGTFKNPDVNLDKTTLLRGGGAIALGAVALPAALIPLIATGNAQLPPENGCVQLLAHAREATAAQSDQPNP